MKYLIKEKLVFRITDPEKAVKKIMQILDNFENIHELQQKRAKSLTSQMEDPLDTIMNVIETNMKS